MNVTFAANTHRWANGSLVMSVPRTRYPTGPASQNASGTGSPSFLDLLGASVNNQSIASDYAAFTFTGLASNTPYWAVGFNPGSMIWVAFNTANVSSQSTAAQTAWTKTTTVAENRPAYLTKGEDTGALTSGTLYLTGGAILAAGATATNINFISGTTAGGTLTNQWFCLVDQSLNVLAKTADDTSTAWAANAKKTLALSAPYTPTTNLPVYIGIMVAATTPPSLRGTLATSFTAALDAPPSVAATSTTGLTNPASLGATAAALTASAIEPYAWIT